VKLPADRPGAKTLVLPAGMGQADVMVIDRTGLLPAHAAGSHTPERVKAFRDAMRP